MSISQQTIPGSTLSIARYTGFAQFMHWLIALTIFGMFALGLTLDGAPRATKTWWVNIHTCVGHVLFAFVLYRLFYRISHTPPPLPAGASDLVRRLGTASHHLMYLFLIAIPIVGIVAAVWHARVFDFGLFQVNFGVANTKSIYEPAENIHSYLVFTFMGLVVLHFLASLWHHFFQKDGMLWRMLPGGK